MILKSLLALFDLMFYNRGKIYYGIISSKAKVIYMEIYEGYYSDKRYQFIYSTDEIKEKVKPIFKYYEIEKVILFGSYARHEATLVSDVDFCIVSPKMKGIKFFSLKGDLEETLCKNVDIFQLHCIEVNSPIYKNIFKEGLTIYSKEN